MPPSAAVFPCCREHDLFGPVEKHGAALRRSLADEAYWFGWESTDDGSATIRIARLGRNAMVFRVHRPSRYGKVRRFHGAIPRRAWARPEDAIVAANFWMLDEHGGEHGLDGVRL
jgi:hypothetical protein